VTIVAQSGGFVAMMQVIFLLICWIANFGASLSGLIFSIFLTISHSDLNSGLIEPIELSDTLQ
jgi:hypothetical protein